MQKSDSLTKVEVKIANDIRQNGKKDLKINFKEAQNQQSFEEKHGLTHHKNPPSMTVWTCPPSAGLEFTCWKDLENKVRLEAPCNFLTLTLFHTAISANPKMLCSYSIL